MGALVSVWLPGDWRQADVSLYRADALAFWGHLGHPNLPAEYPPLAVVPFALALIGPPAVGQDSFALGMAALFVLGFVAVRRWKGASRAWTYAAYTLAAGPATLLFRYDIVPGLLVLGCLWLLERRRFGRIYPLIGVGALVKLFPLLLLPLAAIADVRTGRDSGWRGRAARAGAGVAVSLGVVALGFGLALLVDPTHGLGAITYDLQRPVEVESVPATLMWLGSLAGVPIHAVFAYVAWDVTGSLSGAATLAGDAAMAAGMLWVWWRQLSGRTDAAHAVTASLLVLLCGSAVLSAQYLLWVAPALAVVEGFRFRWLALFLLTALEFPLLFQWAVQYQPTAGYWAVFLAAVGLRNLLLVACTVGFLVGGRREPMPEPEPDRARPAAPSTVTVSG